MTNPTGIIFSRFFAAFAAFITGFLLVPLTFYVFKSIFACFGCGGISACCDAGVNDVKDATTAIIFIQREEITVESTEITVESTE